MLKYMYKRTRRTERVFCLYEVVSEYAKRIWACTKKTLKEHQRIGEHAKIIMPLWRIRRTTYKTVLFSANFCPKLKSLQILKHTPRQDEWAKKLPHDTVPIRYGTECFIAQYLPCDFCRWWLLLLSEKQCFKFTTKKESYYKIFGWALYVMHEYYMKVFRR